MDDKIVEDFMTKTLEIEDWQSKLKESKLQFLREFTFAHATKIYFQNVTWSAIPKAERQIPTEEESIRHGNLGLGGACIQLNYFVKLILDYIGYDVFTVGADAPAWPTPFSHMANVVRFSSKILYLVDLGFGGRPFLEPVPLHNLPYVGTAGGFVYEYRYNKEKDVYERFVRDGCPVRGKREDAVNSVDIYFKLVPLNFNDFSPCHEDLFSAHATSEFMDNLLLFRIFSAKSLDDYNYVTCRNVNLIEGTKTSYKETKFESYEDMFPFVKKYFPNLKLDELEAAIRNYNQTRQAKLAALENN